MYESLFKAISNVLIYNEFPLVHCAQITFRLSCTDVVRIISGVDQSRHFDLAAMKSWLRYHDLLDIDAHGAILEFLENTGMIEQQGGLISPDIDRYPDNMMARFHVTRIAQQNSCSVLNSMERTSGC